MYVERRSVQMKNLNAVCDGGDRLVCVAVGVLSMVGDISRSHSIFP